MLSDPPIEFAIHGERGVDVFRRSENSTSKRSEYECIGCVIGSAAGSKQVLDFSAALFEKPAPSLIEVAERLNGNEALHTELAFGDVRSWPSASTAQDPFQVFVYLDFFRAWQIADLALQRLLSNLEADPHSLPHGPHALPHAVAPALHFNRLALGTRIAEIALPVLASRLDAHGNANDAVLGVGYAMRMLGDIALRAGNTRLALACFETSVAHGDNQHRRRKAIEAAFLNGDNEALTRLTEAFVQKWGRPDWLTQIQNKPLGQNG